MQFLQIKEPLFWQKHLGFKKENVLASVMHIDDFLIYTLGQWVYIKNI